MLVIMELRIILSFLKIIIVANIAELGNDIIYNKISFYHSNITIKIGISIVINKKVF